MATSIKITSLTDIGANLAYNTLVPVVDMAGTPTTEKANLQMIGNLILSGSGGANFVTAARSLTAATVTTAAQPNITSVGTLTALNVTGTVNAGNVAATGMAAASFTGALIGAATTSGTVTGNAQANITTVGTLTSLAVSGLTTIATLAVSGGDPVLSGNSVITHKIPVVINGNTYYIALTDVNVQPIKSPN